MLKDQEVGLDPYFKYRGKNQTRVETFSDAAFALAITLLVLSSTIPSTFAQLWESLKDIISFGLCVTLIMVIWYQHYVFFLRYGLQNLGTLVLNTFLVFLILVYVYPLKFLFKVIISLYTALITGDQEMIQQLFSEVIPLEDSRYLMVIYGLGVALIFSTLGLMYRQAYRHRASLDLNPYETYQTIVSIRTNALMSIVPLLSVVISLAGFFGQFNFLAAGLIYMLYPPVMIIHSKISYKKSKALLKD